MKQKYVWLLVGAILCMAVGAEAWAIAGQTAGNASGIGGIASQVRSNLGRLAQFVTAASYVAGMAFAIGAIAKFKAHKEAPTQVPISTPIVMLFLAAALMFIPSVFSSAGGTLFGGSGKVAGTSGITSFT